VRAQRPQVIGQARGSAGELPLQATNQGAQALLSVGSTLGLLQGRPVGLANVLVQLWPFWAAWPVRFSDDGSYADIGINCIMPTSGLCRLSVEFELNCRIFVGVILGLTACPRMHMQTAPELGASEKA
jgi:hypothetical protein